MVWRGLMQAAPRVLLPDCLQSIPRVLLRLDVLLLIVSQWHLSALQIHTGVVVATEAGLLVRRVLKRITPELVAHQAVE